MKAQTASFAQIWIPKIQYQVQCLSSQLFDYLQFNFEDIKLRFRHQLGLKRQAVSLLLTKSIILKCLHHKLEDVAVIHSRLSYA